MRTTLVFNQKGGVAKTSLATEIAGNFAMKGKKTLIIDFDPQGNVAQTFGMMPTTLRGVDSFKTIFAWLESQEYLFTDNYTPSIKGHVELDGLMGSGDLSQADAKLLNIFTNGTSGTKVIAMMKKLFDKISKDMGYEEIVIDTSPALGFFQGIIMASVDSIIIPSEMSKFSMSGIISVVLAMREMSKPLKLQETELIEKIKFVVPTKLENTIDQNQVFKELNTNLEKKTGVKILPWEEGVPKTTLFTRTVREKETSPVLDGSKNKATEAITKIVEKYLL